MRGRAAWVMGLLAAALVALRALGRRRTLEAPLETRFEPPSEQPADVPDARAEELRRKLAESRELDGERDAFEEGELPVDRAEAAPGPEERRRAVHDEGRAAVDEMRRASSDDE